MGPSVRAVAMAAAGHQRAVGDQGVAVLAQDEHLRAVGGPQGLRGQDVLGGPLSDDAPVEADKPRQVRGHGIEVMGREKNGQPTGLQRVQQMEDVMLRFQVDPDRRFIQEEGLRVAHQRAGEEHPLLLPPESSRICRPVQSPMPSWCMSRRATSRSAAGAQGCPREPRIAPMRMTCSAATGNRQSSASRLGT